MTTISSNTTTTLTTTDAISEQRSPTSSPSSLSLQWACIFQRFPKAGHKGWGDYREWTFSKSSTSPWLLRSHMVSTRRLLVNVTCSSSILMEELLMYRSDAPYYWGGYFWSKCHCWWYPSRWRRFWQSSHQPLCAGVQTQRQERCVFLSSHKFDLTAI